MRTFPAVIFAAMALLPAASAAAADATATLTVTATFSTRTSLDVSADVLHFEVPVDGGPALASVDFSAKARTAFESEVVLSVEPLCVASNEDVSGRGGELTFAGEGSGTLRGTVGMGPTVAGRWAGSGEHHGRLVFALDGMSAGSYTVPVLFVLTAP